MESITMKDISTGRTYKMELLFSERERLMIGKIILLSFFSLFTNIY